MPNDGEPNWLSRCGSSVADFFVRWWREATGPIKWEYSLTPFRAVLRRVYMWTPVLVVVVIVSGALGFYLFTGWRAQDLTKKALANAEEGNARFARLQIFSAMSLRPRDPAVKRAAALIESRLGNPDAVRMWEEVTAGADLSEDEIDARAEVMTLHGSDEQFAVAVSALEQQGATARVAELRSQRSLRRGDMQQAIEQARAAAASDTEPHSRLQLLRLLDSRHGTFLADRARSGPHDLAAAAEMTSLIDGLVDTPLGDEALALGLAAPYFPAGRKSDWAAAAWRNPVASNPALLPAAEFLAVSGAETPAALYNKLNILYIGAPLPQQAAFARWMLRRGMNEQVLVVASASEAAQDEAIFGVRAGALAALGRWEELYQLGNTPSKAPGAVRLMAKARGAHQLGRRGEAEEAARAALQSSVAEGRVGDAITLADAQELRPLADQAIVQMCGDPAVADGAFRLARDRFGRRGQFATLEQAYSAARQAAPSSLSVRDYGLYLELLVGPGVDPSITAEALAAAPTEVGARFNHALALLKAGQGREALAVFEDFDVIVEQLPPGLRAVSAAVLHATGDPNALVVVRGLDPDLLAPAEYALIAPLRMEP
jgi:tetratricopeptide (TPR) repeat protein